MPYKQPPLSDAEIGTLERWVKQGAKFDGPSETETPIASLVDPLAGPARRSRSRRRPSDPVTVAGLLARRQDPGRRRRPRGRPLRRRDGQADGDARPTTPARSPRSRFTPDGKTLIAAGGRPGMFGSVTVWDLATKARRYDLRGHADAILAAALSPDGKTLATAGYDRLVMLWDLAAGRRGPHAQGAHRRGPRRRLLARRQDAGLGRGRPDREALGRRDRASGCETLSDATAELYAVAFGPAGRPSWRRASTARSGPGDVDGTGGAARPLGLRPRRRRSSAWSPRPTARPSSPAARTGT